MIRIFFMMIVFGLLLNADKIESKNIYEENCIPCHRFLPSSLDQMFMMYLKAYSGKLSVKISMKMFLKEPTEGDSLMSNFFIDRFSVKDKTKLSDEELDEALDIYWDLYDVRRNLE